MVDIVSDAKIAFGLIGTYDVSNFGDCIFANIYQDQLAKRFPNAVFTLYAPTPHAADIMTLTGVKGLPDKLDGIAFPEDCLIQTGGETLSSGHSSGTYIFPLNTMSSYLRMWAGPIVAASRTATRSIIYCVGLPYGNEAALPLISRLLMSADLVVLRDTVSATRLEDRFSVGVDPVFMMSDMASDDVWQARAQAVMPNALMKKPYVVFQISQSYLNGNLRDWCDSVAAIMNATANDALFMPICNFLNDSELLTIAAKQMRTSHPALAQRIHIAEGLPDVLATAALLSQCDGYVGSSLHGAVASVSFAKPMAVLAQSLAGKHAQTLLSAGVDVGVTDTIADLPACFQRSRATDLVERRAEAMRRAAADFDAMCATLVMPRPRRPAPAQAEIDALLAIDRQPARPWSVRIKRWVFSAMRKVPGLWRIYENRKFRKQFSFV